MKIFYLFALFSFAFCGITNAQNKLTYIEVVKVDSTMKQSDLFVLARKWFSEVFKNPKNVLDIEDKERGELAGKSVIQYTSNGSASATNGYINFNVSILVKDGRYKYEFTDFVHIGSFDIWSFDLITTDEDCPYKKGSALYSKKSTNEMWKDIKFQIDETIKPLISSLKDAMSKKVNNNW